MKRLSVAALVLAICLLILGWFDHHAAEYDPQHTHLAPGLLGIALDVGAIPHTHAFAVDHSHGDKAAHPTTLVNGDPGTVVTAAVSLHATGTKTATAVLPASDLVQANRFCVDVIFLSSLWFPAVTLDVLDPPPRSA